MLIDAVHFAAGAVLDSRLPWRAVLGREGDQVALTQPVVLVRQLQLAMTEFASLGTQMLGAGVEPVDLDVRRVGDQCDITNVACLVSSAQRWTAAYPAWSRV
jgi:hypothetical protein